MLIQMLTHSDDLVLRTGAHVDELSKDQTTPDVSEKLFHTFVTRLDTIAARTATTNGPLAAAR
jgi:hypothetical protein